MTDTAQERVEGERADLEDYCRWSEGIAGKLERKYGGGDPEAETPVEIAAATYLRKLASEVRRLRARQRKEGDNCTCPRWAEQHGWDSECPRHGYDWDRACDYEDHVPGDSSYGRTGRGGIMVRCQKCEAPLEIHPDDGNKYTERWHGEAATPNGRTTG